MMLTPESIQNLVTFRDIEFYRRQQLALHFRLKAMIAQSKHSGGKSDFQDQTTMTRLFVICPKDFNDEDLRSKFESFGDIEYVQIVRDHKTRENKGYGYVKFHKSSTAAMALENCDKSLKAVWAEPKSHKIARDAAAVASATPAFGVPLNPFLEPAMFPAAAIPQPTVQPAMHQQALDFFSNQTQVNPAAAQVAESIANSHTPMRLFVIISTAVTQEQVVRLFDIIPGMQVCDLKRNYNTGESKGFAYVTYNSVGSAIYAKEKLNGFEYPPGNKLVVKFAEDPPSGRPGGNDTSMQHMYDSKSSLPSMAGFSIDGSPVYTTAALPAPAPLADQNADVASRLFIVCNPAPPPDHVLKDVFSRFGNLIDVWMMKERNFGYAKFAAKQSADAAIQGLHGHDVLGMKLKVMLADPPRNESSRKRPRT
ncbi:RNA-binding protein 45 isoform X2 [Nematostella vectensis]|uniref:RNA-binding protein 45 isoform X2 n=1 Tax=Nematostella vectensis TaxID=45351 RepID=UPI00138FC090|nr:RNA-binding protein 45 isoform X2 [Nematostella vectensis]